MDVPLIWRQMSAAVTWVAPFVNSDDQGELLSDMKTFTQSGVGTTNTVYGYYVVDAAGTGLLWAEKFDEPFFATAVGRTLPVIARYLLGNQAA